MRVLESCSVKLMFVMAFFAACSWVMGSGLIIIIPPPPHPPIPPPMPPPRPVFQPVQLESLKVMTEIQDLVATTRFEHTFYNPNARPVEGHFIFPVPEDAHVEQFSMTINGRETPAELLDAKKAREIYDDIVRSMRDPAILQYHGSGLLKADVFPIDAHGRKHVQLTLRQVLPKYGDFASWRCALPHVQTRPISSLHVDLRVKTTQALKTAFSPSHAFEVLERDGHSAHFDLTLRDHIPSRDIEFLVSWAQDVLGCSLLTYRSDTHEDGFFMLSITPELQLKTNHALPKDIAFVVDTSGSMAGDKLKQARTALSFCLNTLEPGDRFQIIRFSTEAEALAPSWLSARGDDLARGLAFVDDMQAMGGTHVEDALRQVLRLARDPGRLQAVMLLSDGKPTIGVRDDDELAALLTAQNQAMRVFCFGIGDQINTHLLDRISTRAGGTCTYVHAQEDLELKVSQFFASIKTPVLASPHLSSRGVKLKALHPNPIPDLFSGKTQHILGVYEGHGQAELTLEGTFFDGARSRDYEFEFPKEDSKGDFVARLWAQRRVAFLLDEIRLHGESQELREEVVKLARKFGIISPYTSYLIVEDEERLVADGAVQRESTWLSQPGVAKQTTEWRRRFGGLAEESGVRSVETARDLKAMQEADAPIPSHGSSQGTSGEPGAISIWVVGRSLVFRDGEWLQAELWGRDRSRDRIIAFASDEYFRFLHDHPSLAPILALGAKLRFLWDDQIITVRN